MVTYSVTRLIAFLGALAGVIILVRIEHPYWAILPAAMATILGLSVAMVPGVAGDDGGEEP